ncbi:MAG: hypothetical protein Q9226_006676, partial [Calogaya cf. arnoldii]
MVRHWQSISGCVNSGPQPDSKTGDVTHADDCCSLFEPVAIVGMAMRLPGSVHNAEDFWDMLIHKRSGQCVVPKTRYNIDAWYGPGKAGHVTSKYGYFLDDQTLDAMDTSFWSMTRQEVEALDPQQRLLLEVVYETFQSAGAKEWKDKNVGCYIGTFEGDWLELDGRDPETNYPYRLTGYGDYMAANRISYEFGLRGPSACQDLFSGECTSAIVGATNLILSPRTTVTMQAQGVMSPTGSCKSFDANADGYARGEAVSALYIKKLATAIRDGDPIRAVIKSTCINSDGKGVSLTTPNLEAHEDLIRRGHALAGYSDFSKTAMIECHGTGTTIGDPIEAMAVARVFGEHGIYIGSVKPNLGHSEGASGLSSVIKMVLALEHNTIPPNINFKTPNLDRSEIEGPDGMSTMASGAEKEGREPETAESIPSLLVFSAKHPQALRRMAEDHESYLSANPMSLRNMSYSLAKKRETLSHRAFSVSTGEDAFELSRVAKPDNGMSPRLVFTFTGQGAVWAMMGKELIEREPTFRDSIRALGMSLSILPEAAQLDLEALVDLLDKWGVKPDAVVGHSSGEISAAYACGAITAQEAITVAYHRGRVLLELSKRSQGGMAVVGLGRDDVAPYLVPGVTIGCENSSSSTTLSGDQEPLNVILETIRTRHPQILARRLHVQVAYHSHHMEPIADEYHASIHDYIEAQSPKVPFYSSVTGGIVEAGPGILGATYWTQNLVSPVLFLSAIKSVLESNDSPKVFLEIGPHSALAGPLRQIAMANEAALEYIPTLIRHGNSQNDLLKTVGELWLNNCNPDFEAIIGNARFLRDLPSYPWHYEESYWAESRLSREWRLREYPRHDILGSRIIESTSFDPCWRNLLSLDSAPWVREHEILGEVVFPGAGFICMTAEAIRQLSGYTDFTLRQVSFNTPLVLHHGPPLEIITSLHRIRLTTSLDSAWYDFSIASMNGPTWVRHCFGQIKAGASTLQSTPKVESQERAVSSLKWYSVMRDLGLEYGPRFSVMTEISTSTVRKLAVATTQNDSKEREEYHTIHPVSLDCAFQLFSVAAYQGLQRHFRSPAIPSFIEELCVRPAKRASTMQATINSHSNGTMSGDLLAISEGTIVIVMKGLRLSSVGDNATMSGDPHAAAQLMWDRDVDFLDTSRLIRPKVCSTEVQSLLEELGLASTIETHHRLHDMETTQPYHTQYLSWLESQSISAAENCRTQFIGGASLTNMNSEERMTLINKLVERAEGTEAAAVASTIYRVLSSCRDILSRRTEPLDTLQHDGLLERVHDFMQQSDLSEFLALAAHQNPTLRVLEIGSGVGCNSSCVLPHLRSFSGQRMYSTYLYTANSISVLETARGNFKDYEAVQYATLDISKDPLEQGFEPASFDLIVACNALHTVAKLSIALKHVRGLLRPRGRLFLQELSPVTKWINYVMGILPGWWVGEHDQRINEPYISGKRWETELRNAGFDGLDAIVHDGFLNNNMIAIPVPTRTEHKRITVLRGKPETYTLEIENGLRKAGYVIDYCTIDHCPTPNQDIVSLLDISELFLDSVDESNFNSFRKFVASIKSCGVLWVTGAAQINCQDPRYGLILGLARTIRNEFSIDFATLEMDHFDEQCDTVVCKVLRRFHDRTGDPDFTYAMEWAYSEGDVKISRYHWISVIEELLEPHRQSSLIRLDIDKPGLTNTLHWKWVDTKLLKGDEVEVDVRAVGLNYRVGDRVMCNSGGCFTSVVTASENLCARIPDNLSFVEAATMPIVYCTVIHCLLDVAKMQPGNTILIHSACGGVGLAALQLCQANGVEIYCTVGNAEKVNYLVERHGIPRNRIFSSRDETFFPNIMEATRGKGTDIVLNSLSGELLHVSWKCVAEFGIMVDIGKRDFQGKAVLAMDHFEANRSYAGIDLSQISLDRPSKIQRQVLYPNSHSQADSKAHSLLSRTMELFRQDSIKPIRPIKIFGADSIEDAFRYMQK